MQEYWTPVKLDVWTIIWLVGKKEHFYRPVCSRCESVTHEPSEEGGLADSELSAQNHFLLRDFHTRHFPWLASLASLLLVFSLICFATSQKHQCPHRPTQPSARIWKAARFGLGGQPVFSNWGHLMTHSNRHQYLASQFDITICHQYLVSLFGINIWHKYLASIFR